ncbi:protein-L-isoaspartate O-methyltransferase domain-containing protein 1 isoform X1 [Ascaphus truei]|uniref:protein-L-isoaspartate O-methyltransferase domain-containing protein 1 isoform X1 n=1 Tax=Ascaphus truei TaxID=8439 RepID=UPI003F593024
MNLLGKETRIKIKTQKISFQNLNYDERHAVKTLKQNKNIIIRAADKGGGIVVLDYLYYKEEVKRQLADEETYMRLSRDPTLTYKADIDSIIQLGITNGWISEDTGKFLTQQHPKMPVLYTIPKIHKSVTHPPGRQIISARSSLCHPLSQYVYFYLQPLVACMATYVKDTTDFMAHINNLTFDPSKCILFTLDVTSLYTNIPHREGLDAIRSKLSNRTITTGPPSEFLLLLMEIILNKNFFRFERTYYLQLSGTAMGSNMAPSYANLYMDMYEQTHILYDAPYAQHIQKYVRYIDDIFILWSGDTTELNIFVEHLNSFPSKIRFTLCYSELEIPFLDTMVYKKGGTLATRLYQKATDKNTLLHASSHQPVPLKKGLPYSQLLRVKRITSDPGKVDVALMTMATRFLERGYSPADVKYALDRVTALDRKALESGRPRAEQNKRFNVISTFSTASTCIQRSVKEN